MLGHADFKDNESVDSLASRATMEDGEAMDCAGILSTIIHTG